MLPGLRLGLAPVFVFREQEFSKSNGPARGLLDAEGEFFAGGGPTPAQVINVMYRCADLLCKGLAALASEVRFKVHDSGKP